MNFVNVIDQIQFFANEYTKSGDTVLVVGSYNESIKKIFSFIEAESFFVHNQYEPGIDFVYDLNDLPFEERSFDLIVNMTKCNVSHLTKGPIFDLK
jgi:hypothetical protein